MHIFHSISNHYENQRRHLPSISYLVMFFFFFWVPLLYSHLHLYRQRHWWQNLEFVGYIFYLDKNIIVIIVFSQYFYTIKKLGGSMHFILFKIAENNFVCTSQCGNHFFDKNFVKVTVLLKKLLELILRNIFPVRENFSFFHTEMFANNMYVCSYIIFL